MTQRPILRFRFFMAALLVLALGGAIGSAYHAQQSKADDDDDTSEGSVNPPARLAIKNGVSILTLTAVEQQNAGILAARLDLAPEEEDVHAFATVLDAASLIDLSNQYRDAEGQVQAASAKLEVSRAAFERAKILHQDQQNISTAQLQSAQSNFDIDTSALAAARIRVSTVAATALQSWGSVIGMALTAHGSLVSDLIERRIYLVRVTVPPGTALQAPPPTADSLNGGADVKLTFVSPATAADPRLQGISYFYSTPAKDGLLPGLNLEVSLAAKMGKRGLMVPDSAVVWLEGKAWIYLHTDPKTFVRREIDPHRPAPKDGYIVTGLAPDSEIVVRGAQMLLSEEFRASVPVED